MNLLSESEKLKMQALKEEAAEATSRIKARENNPLMTAGTGLMFPFTDDAKDGISKYSSQGVNYLRFKIDTKKEVIALDEKSSITSANDLASTVPKTCASFN